MRRQLIDPLLINIWDFYDNYGRLRPVETWTSAMRAGVAALQAMLEYHQQETGTASDAETLRLLARLDEGRKRNATEE